MYKDFNCLQNFPLQLVRPNQDPDRGLARPFDGMSLELSWPCPGPPVKETGWAVLQKGRPPDWSGRFLMAPFSLFLYSYSFWKLEVTIKVDWIHVQSFWLKYFIDSVT